MGDKPAEKRAMAPCKERSMISANAVDAYEWRSNGELRGGDGGVEGRGTLALRALAAFDTSLSFGAALVEAARLAPEGRFHRWSIIAPSRVGPDPPHDQYGGRAGSCVNQHQRFDAQWSLIVRSSHDRCHTLCHRRVGVSARWQFAGEPAELDVVLRL